MNSINKTVWPILNKPKNKLIIQNKISLDKSKLLLLIMAVRYHFNKEQAYKSRKIIMKQLRLINK